MHSTTAFWKPEITSKIAAVMAIFFVFGLFLPAKAAAYTVVKYEQFTPNLSNQTLTKDKSPYLVLGGCMIVNSKVSSGYTFTIEAGVVVKFAPAGTCFGSGVHTRIGISGNFIVNGTAADPVIFTSWNDDAAGGDTNGDASSTQPHPGDWGGLEIENSGNNNVSINHAIIRYGGGGNFISELKIERNINFLQLNNLELSYSGNYGLNTKIPITITSSSFHDNNIGAVRADPFWNPQVTAINNWWGNASGPTTPSNPGGTGQRFVGNVIYDPWVGKKVKNDPVIIIPGIMGSEQKDGVWVIDPILHTYDNLIDTFKANGYTEGVDLFTFPYQWRQSNVLTAFELHQKIDEIKDICDCDKVDLVGHSMGGLVARQYIQSNYYEHDVDQLIFLGTPHLGAPKAYLIWEAGEFPSDFTDRALSFIISREARKAGYTDIFDYVRHSPITSVEELLPIYDYLKDKNTNTLRQYPDNYPRNQFLEKLNVNVDDLYNSGVSTTNIVGDVGSSSTLSILRVVDSPFLPLWEHGFLDGYDNFFGDRGLEQSSGDRTVPLISGEYISSGIKILNSTHNELPTNAQATVINTLTGIVQPNTVNHQYFPNLRILIIKILSPADIVVIAPDGKRVGKDFATGQEFAEIDGAFYSGFTTDNEYITIPNPLDGQYRVQAQGTGGGGEYTIATGYISDDFSASNDFRANILPGMVSELKIDVNSSTPEDLSVTPTDSVPPEIIFLSPFAPDYQRPFILPIIVMVTDTDSGIYSQSLSFDGNIISNGDLFDLFLLPLGIHTVTATATDFMGNVAVAFATFKLIATVSSTISDVERVYLLGWISDPGIKNSLVKKVQKIKKEEYRNFLNELDAQRGKYVNEQAFLLIQEDINWLINN